jgi:hypothetical protein
MQSNIVEDTDSWEVDALIGLYRQKYALMKDSPSNPPLQLYHSHILPHWLYTEL